MALLLLRLVPGCSVELEGRLGGIMGESSNDVDNMYKNDRILF